MIRLRRRIMRVIMVVGVSLALGGGAIAWIVYNRGDEVPPWNDNTFWDAFAAKGIKEYAALLNSGSAREAQEYFDKVDTALEVGSEPPDEKAEAEGYEKYLKRLLYFRENTVGPGKYVADVLKRTIIFKDRIGNYADTVDECDRSMSRIEAGFGTNSPSVASALTSCGYALKQTGDDLRGDAFLSRARQIRDSRRVPMRSKHAEEK